MSHLRRFHMHPLTALVTMMLMATAGTAAGDEKHDQKFEVRQQKAIKALEKKLSVKSGALPEDTWYVLAFFDEAYQAEFVPPTRSGYYGSYGGYWSRDAKRDVTYHIVKGQRAAAEAVYQFLNRASSSASKLRPATFSNVSRWQKEWSFKAFASAKEAEDLYDYYKVPEHSFAGP